MEHTKFRTKGNATHWEQLTGWWRISHWRCLRLHLTPPSVALTSPWMQVVTWRWRMWKTICRNVSGMRWSSRYLSMWLVSRAEKGILSTLGPKPCIGITDIDFTEVTVCAKRHVFFQDLYLNLHTAPAAVCFPSLTQPLNTTQVTFIWMRATSDIKTNFSIMFDKRRNNKIEDSWASVCTFPCPGIALNDGNHILLPDFEKKMNSKEVYNKAPCSFSVLYEVSMKWT